MQSIDRYTIQELKLPSMVLMERAALAVAKEVEERAEKGERILCACGCGNNGADGVAVARLLVLAGHQAQVVYVGDPEKGSQEFRQQAAIAEKLGITVTPYPAWEKKAFDILVDGIFGVGLSRPVGGVYGQFMEDLEKAGPRLTVAVDVPSGIRSDDGQVLGKALQADVTVTFGWEKLGTVLYPGRAYAGTVVVADIGFPEMAFAEAERCWTGAQKPGDPGGRQPGALVAGREPDASAVGRQPGISTAGWQPETSAAGRQPGTSAAGQQFAAWAGEPPPERHTVCAFTCEPGDLGMRRPLRPAYSNKGTFGRVLLVAGSRNMCGAAYLSALAGYRTGAGLVKILTVEENREALQAGLPEAILETYPSQVRPEEMEGYQEMLREDCGWADVVVLGPGLGQAPYAKALVEMVLAQVCSPLIVDADALNILAADPNLTGYFTENIIITPHLGEMARLTGKTIEEIQKDLIGTAREYGARYGITCVLKDAATVAALRDGRVYVNTSGNSAMAKAGSGDVLTGVLAGLLAQGVEEMDGVALAVYLHGAAGDRYREEHGPYGMLAGELADYVGKVLAHG